MVVIVEGFPEANPDVEQTQAAAQATKKTGGDQGTKPGKGKEKIIVCPLGGPGQDQEQDAGNGANQHEEKDGGAVQPELRATLDVRRGISTRLVENPCAVIGRRRVGLVRHDWSVLD